jgi:hypothetical protein
LSIAYAWCPLDSRQAHIARVPCQLCVAFAVFTRAVRAGLCERAGFDSTQMTGSRPCCEGASATLAVPVYRFGLAAVSRSCSAFCPLTIRGHRREPRRSRSWAGLSFWGKQIEMAVSPCRYGLKWARFQKLSEKSTAARSARMTGTAMPAGALRQDPSQPPFCHPAKRRPSRHRD